MLTQLIVGLVALGTGIQVHSYPSTGVLTYDTDSLILSKIKNAVRESSLDTEQGSKSREETRNRDSLQDSQEKADIEVREHLRTISRREVSEENIINLAKRVEQYKYQEAHKSSAESRVRGIIAEFIKKESKNLKLNLENVWSNMNNYLAIIQEVLKYQQEKKTINIVVTDYFDLHQSKAQKELITNLIKFFFQHVNQIKFGGDKSVLVPHFNIKLDTGLDLTSQAERIERIRIESSHIKSAILKNKGFYKLEKNLAECESKVSAIQNIFNLVSQSQDTASLNQIIKKYSASKYSEVKDFVKICQSNFIGQSSSASVASMRSSVLKALSSTTTKISSEMKRLSYQLNYRSSFNNLISGSSQTSQLYSNSQVASSETSSSYTHSRKETHKSTPSEVNTTAVTGTVSNHSTSKINKSEDSTSSQKETEKKQLESSPKKNQMMTSTDSSPKVSEEAKKTIETKDKIERSSQITLKKVNSQDTQKRDQVVNSQSLSDQEEVRSNSKNQKSQEEKVISFQDTQTKVETQERGQVENSQSSREKITTHSNSSDQHSDEKKVISSQDTKKKVSTQKTQEGGQIENSQASRDKTVTRSNSSNHHSKEEVGRSFENTPIKVNSHETQEGGQVENSQSSINQTEVRSRSNDQQSKEEKVISPQDTPTDINSQETQENIRVKKALSLRDQEEFQSNSGNQHFKEKKVTNSQHTPTKVNPQEPNESIKIDKSQSLRDQVEVQSNSKDQHSKEVEKIEEVKVDPTEESPNISKTRQEVGSETININSSAKSSESLDANTSLHRSSVENTSSSDDIKPSKSNTDAVSIQENPNTNDMKTHQTELATGTQRSLTLTDSSSSQSSSKTITNQKQSTERSGSQTTDQRDVEGIETDKTTKAPMVPMVPKVPKISTVPMVQERSAFASGIDSDDIIDRSQDTGVKETHDQTESDIYSRYLEENRWSRTSETYDEWLLRFKRNRSGNESQKNNRQHSQTESQLDQAEDQHQNSYQSDDEYHLRSPFPGESYEQYQKRYYNHINNTRGPEEVRKTKERNKLQQEKYNSMSESERQELNEQRKKEEDEYQAKLQRDRSMKQSQTHLQGQGDYGKEHNTRHHQSTNPNSSLESSSRQKEVNNQLAQHNLKGQSNTQYDQSHQNSHSSTTDHGGENNSKRYSSVQELNGISESSDIVKGDESGSINIKYDGINGNGSNGQYKENNLVSTGNYQFGGQQVGGGDDDNGEYEYQRLSRSRQTHESGIDTKIIDSIHSPDGELKSQKISENGHSSTIIRESEKLGPKFSI